MKKFEVIRQDLYDMEETTRFTSGLSKRTTEGYKIESCGIGGDTARIGWAILSKAVIADREKEFDMLDAAKRIATACRDRTGGCEGCPLNKGATCLAGLKGKAIPVHWPVLKEV